MRASLHLLGLLVLCLEAAPSLQWSERDYLVSATTGRDDDSLSGSESEPWQSLAYAVQRIRNIRNHNNPPSSENTATIHLTGEVHYLEETLALNTRDTFLTITSYSDEEATVSGGFPLNITWEREGDIRHGEYQGQCGDMYYGDFRMMKARSPNIASYGVNSHYATGPYHTVAGFLVENDNCKMDTNHFSQDCPAENKNGFYLNDEMSPDWDDIGQTQILFFHSWINEYARVKSVSSDGGRTKVMFREPLSHAAVGVWIQSGGLRYLVVNNRAVLDLPGEYVCTEHGDTARVSWIPPTGADEEVVPVMTKLEVIVEAINVETVRLEAVRFQHSSYQGLDRSMDWQHAAVVVKRSSDVQIVNCEISHTAMTGLFVSMSSEVTVERNVFTDIGYHGLLQMGAYDIQNISISNNYFDGSGITRYWSTNAIFSQGSRNVLIANNEVTRTMGGGIMVKSESLGKDYWTEQGNTDWVVNVEYNYIHDFGAGITSDFGGIKTGSVANCDAESEAGLERNCFTYIRVYNNLLTNGWPYYCCAEFLYSDVSAGKNLFENNILYGSGSGALFHHCGLENEAKNNIVHRLIRPDNGQQPLSDLWGACEANSGKFQSFSNHHNIYYFENTEGLRLYKPHNWFDEQTVFTDNLYYSLVASDEFKGMFPPSDLAFADLPSVGSVRNQWADPLFASAEGHDYLLAEDSPAQTMGIVQIRLDNFGIQNGKQLQFLRRNQ